MPFQCKKCQDTAASNLGVHAGKPRHRQTAGKWVCATCDQLTRLCIAADDMWLRPPEVTIVMPITVCKPEVRHSL